LGRNTHSGYTRVEVYFEEEGFVINPVNFGMIGFYVTDGSSVRCPSLLNTMSGYKTIGLDVPSED
jgi:hypothetical protein